MIFGNGVPTVPGTNRLLIFIVKNMGKKIISLETIPMLMVIPKIVIWHFEPPVRFANVVRFPNVVPFITVADK